MNFYGLLNASKEQEIQTNGKNMKQIKNIKNKLEWEKYYDPTFDWDDYTLYTDNNLSEDFIREFQDKVDWLYISRFQTLSEDFIREFKDKVWWKNIFINQKLSEDFILEFKDEADACNYWTYAFEFQQLSEEFKNKIINELDSKYENFK